MNSRSVSASLAALFTSTATCGTQLQSIIDALRYSSVPSEILALSNEVNDLRAVLAEVEANHQIMSRSIIVTGQAEYTDARTADQLERACSKIIELDRLISSSIKLSQHNKQIVRKAVWLRSKDSIAAKIRELREIKHNIVLIMASRTA